MRQKSLSRIISCRKIVLYALLVELYNVSVILLDTCLRSDSPIRGVGFGKAVSMFVNTMIPDTVIVFSTFIIVFYVSPRLRLPSGNFYKVLADVVVSTLWALVVYKLFHLILLQCHPDLSLNWNEAFVNVTFILLIVEIIYFLHKNKQAVEEIEEAKREALQYRYNVLKAQVNPHFLFNSLNILSSLVSVDVRKSEEFIDALSEMYRYVTDCQDKPLVDMEEELASLDSYVAILKIRYCNQFDVVFTGREKLAGKKIVPMTMQLLIENVTKHNVISSKYPMTVRVSIGADAVEVINPVRPRRTLSSGSGVGLSYISEQYRLGGKEVLVTNENGIFSVRVPYLNSQAYDKVFGNRK